LQLLQFKVLLFLVFAFKLHNNQLQAENFFMSTFQGGGKKVCDNL
jgi:hypothetical protein